MFKLKKVMLLTTQWLINQSVIIIICLKKLKNAVMLDFY